jgi:uncharacterized protein (DUF4415 family)
MKRRERLGRKGRVVSLRACDGDFSSTVDQPGGSGSLPSLRTRRPLKKRVTMYLDADVLAWLKSRGPRYQREINWMLRRVMEKEQGPR